MTSGTVPLLLLALGLSAPAFAQQSAQFNQVLNLNGDMQINSFQFPDNSRVETFSQSQRQLIVNQQTPPVDPNQVTGTTGQPFVALSQQSMTISTNGATDLVGGQIEMSIGQNTLQQANVNPDNTFVAQLAPDRQSWMIMETIRSVNVSDNTVRMVKRNSIDGEYMVIGRQTQETNNVLVPFQGNVQNGQVIQGSGLQELEFVDGFRMSVRATQPMTVTTDVKNGVEQGMLTQIQGQMPVNDFRYLVTTNLAGVRPDLNRQQTVVQLPINAIRVQQMAMQMTGGDANGQVAVGIAQRPVQQNPGGANAGLTNIAGGQGQGTGAAPPGRRQNTPTTGNTGTGTTGNNPAAAQLLLEPTFTPVNAQAVLDPLNGRVAVPVGQVDGEFIITMQNMAGGAAQPQAGQQPQAGAQPPAEQPQAGAQPAAGEAQPATASNGTAAAEPPRPAEGQPPAGEQPKKRQDNKADEPKPPMGAVIMTMREINQMAESARNGGYINIGQMMSDYKKSQGM